MLPTGPQPLLGIHLLWWVLQELQMELCSITDFHGLWGDSLPHHGLHHELQGNHSSAATIADGLSLGPWHILLGAFVHVKGAG